MSAEDVSFRDLVELAGKHRMRLSIGFMARELAFDPHALGMALVLAKLLEAEPSNSPYNWVGAPEFIYTSNWLRLQVECELLSQAGAR